MNASRLLEILPWRHPFLMIDRMVECVPHESILTWKQVSAGDPVFGDAARSPCECFPSLLLLEGMSQSAALLFRLSYPDADGSGLPLLGFLQAALHGTARPGDRIAFSVRSKKMTRNGGVFEAWAHVEQATLAQAELAFSSARHTNVATPGASE